MYSELPTGFDVIAQARAIVRACAASPSPCAPAHPRPARRPRTIHHLLSVLCVILTLLAIALMLALLAGAATAYTWLWLWPSAPPT